MHLVFKVSEGWPVGEPPVVTDGPGVVHKDSLLDDGRTFRLTYQLNDEESLRPPASRSAMAWAQTGAKRRRLCAE